MKFGRVIGQVIAPRKESNVEGLKLLVVRYLNADLAPLQKIATCVDSVSANVGDVVLLVASSSARMTKVTRNVCTDNTIIGVVDLVSSGREDLFRRETADVKSET
jgi:ethanolamine utilization protein EutN